MDYYSVLKRNELSSPLKTWWKLKCILQSERSESEKATYCRILTIWYSGKAKLWRQWKICVAKIWIGGERWIGGRQKIFEQWKYSVWYHNDGYMPFLHWSKPIECTTPKVNPEVNCGLWVIMMCQCRFISCDKCTSWWRMLIMGEVIHV